MALFNSTDDAQRGAPYAICPHDDAIRYLAPNDCILVVGSNPPVYEFHRHDYCWLAFALAGVDPVNTPYLEHVRYGTHTLRWDAMHETIARAMLSGFAPTRPSGFASVIFDAMVWSQANQARLNPLTFADFEPLPAFPQGAPDMWWLSIPYSSWQTEGSWLPLCHAMGFAGRFWDVQSRSEQSRLHLSLLLTQEFLSVSATMPPTLYGDPAVRFYTSTMPPQQLTFFPESLTRLHSSLTIRWGYHHGGAAHLHAVLSHIIPRVLDQCTNLARFLVPAANTASQVAAYRSIAALLAPSVEAHKLETFTYLLGLETGELSAHC